MPEQKITVGFAEDVFREQLLEKAQLEHPMGILVCVICGWAWLRVETAKIHNTMKNFAVVCRDDYECVRRKPMRMWGKETGVENIGTSTE